MKQLIWIQGGYGSGKTTQLKLLLAVLTETADKAYLVEQTGSEPYLYTIYGTTGVAVIGKVGRNQCTGLDSVYGKLKPEGVARSVQKAIEDPAVELLIIECAFATFSWYQRWIDLGIRDKFKLYSIHLELSLWHVYKRIAERRCVKHGIENWWEVELADSVYKNAGNKNRETRLIYDKVKGDHPKSTIPADYSLRLDGTRIARDLHDDILAFIA